MSKLDLVLAGTKDAILMIEGYCDFLTEEEMLQVCVHVVCVCMLSVCLWMCVHVNACVRVCILSCVL